MANENCSVKWLTSLHNLIVAHGRIPDDWRSSILLPVFKGKRSNGMWILQSDKVTGTCNESDRTSVRTNQGKVDRTDPVLISLCSSVVQKRSSTKL